MNAVPTAAVRSPAAAAERRERAVFAVATLAAWGHTLDEMRIGEFIAVPFGVANAALVAGWTRLGAAARGWSSIAFGLFWGLAVIPYHVVPLFTGTVTGQHVSGLLRVVAGASMVALGVAILRQRARSQTTSAASASSTSTTGT